MSHTALQSTPAEIGLLPNRHSLGASSAFVPMLVFGITVAAFALCVLVPALPVGRNTEDFIAILDGARRILHGLTPHVDFPLPHGPLPLYQAMIPYIFRYETASFLLYQWIGWLLVLPALVAVAFTQPTLPRATFVLGFVALATLIPMIVEYDNGPELSYHASYNRLTTALLFLILVWIFSARHAGKGQALLIGYMLALLAATKVTAFVGAVGILTIFGVLAAPARRTLLQAAILLLVAIAIAQVLTGIPFAYLRDIQMMLDLNKGGMAYAASTMVMRNIVVVMACVAVMILLMPRSVPGTLSAILRQPIGRAPAFARAWRPVLLLGAALSMLILVESQNTGSIGLAALAAILVARLPQRRCSRILGPMALTALGVATLGPWVTSVTFRMSHVVGRQMTDLVKDPAVAQLLPRTMVTRATSALAVDYEQIWQAGVRNQAPLVVSRAWIDASERNQHAMFVAQARLVVQAAEAARRTGLIDQDTDVFTAGETELFAPLLSAPALRGIGTWHSTRASKRMPVDRLRDYLKPVDIAFRARCGLATRQAGEAQAFEEALAFDFVKVELTPCWEAWRRRSATV